MNYRMKQWSEKVWRRDDWTCQNCGATTHLDAGTIRGQPLTIYKILTPNNPAHNLPRSNHSGSSPPP